jgi:hypothetical protein
LLGPVVLGAVVIGLRTNANRTASAARNPVVPVPVIETRCGLSVLLSVIERVALACPLTLGVNVTVMVQEAPTATLAVQVLVCAYSEAPVPVIVMLELVKAMGAAPVLVNVTVSVLEAPGITFTEPKSRT